MIYTVLGNATLPEECFQPGECREGEHLSRDFVEDKFVCLELCKSNPNCRSFTFSPKENLCDLLANCSILDSDICSECLSGTFDCVPKEPICFIQGSII